MAAKVWKKNPITVAQGYGARHGQNSVEPLFVWATWTAEGMFYLDDIDAVQVNYPSPVLGHNPDIVDIAHVRWATGTAITSLDLCAGALGRAYCSVTGSREMDLRDFDPNSKSKQVAGNRAKLPGTALAWVDSVFGDSRYKDIHPARNSFTHAWLTRHLQRQIGAGPNSDHATRTSFKVASTGVVLGARVLIEHCRDLAGERVDEFILLIDTL